MIRAKTCNHIYLQIVKYHFKINDDNKFLQAIILKNRSFIQLHWKKIKGQMLQEQPNVYFLKLQ